MVSQCWRTWSRSCCVVMPSMPGAPPLRLTASQAAVAFSCVTTCSIRSSCITFCGESRVRCLLVVHSRGLRRLLRLGLGWPDRGGDRPAGAGSRPAVSDGSRSFFQVLIEFCSFVLRPFARSAFLFVRTSDATMASADSPAPLSAGVSPGQGLLFPFAPLGSTECRQ